jgi:glycine/D-amino acid oxidase-like deaminating enzyme
VHEISQSQNPDGSWTVTTPRGKITAGKLILATNAFTSALAPEYSKAIVPCKGVCTQIAAAPGAPRQELPCTYCIRLGPGAFIYQISRNDGSLIVGGASHTFKADLGEWFGNPDDGTLVRGMERYFDGYMQRTFFGWEDSGAEVKHIWSGGMCYPQCFRFLWTCDLKC